MTNFDRIRNLIIEYEILHKMTKDELLDEICKVCFGRKLGHVNI